jgi:hypothetical protein
VHQPFHHFDGFISGFYHPFIIKEEKRLFSTKKSATEEKSSSQWRGGGKGNK